jgi:GTPase SAR1 family protein
MLTRSCTQGVIYAYDVTRRETFESIQQTWMKEVESSSTIEKAVKMVVATKVDRDSEREVSRQEGAMFAKSKGCLFVETSAKANTAVTQVGFSLYSVQELHQAQFVVMLVIISMGTACAMCGTCAQAKFVGAAAKYF